MFNQLTELPWVVLELEFAPRSVVNNLTASSHGSKRRHSPCQECQATCVQLMEESLRVSLIWKRVVLCREKEPQRKPLHTALHQKCTMPHRGSAI
jgi:hypothetical protein